MDTDLKHSGKKIMYRFWSVVTNLSIVVYLLKKWNDDILFAQR